MFKKFHITVKNNKFLSFAVLCIVCFILAGWGAVGHKLINRKATYNFPPQMSAFNYWRDSLAYHASDADYRKSSDTAESRRHFIDIDEYGGFIATGRIPQTLDSLYALYGYNFVMSNGIVPFAIIAFTDSVKKAFQQGNWQKAMLHSADLGHYVADAHQPLHITRNYDGQYTNQSGIHSRYETQMINRDSSYIQFPRDSVLYVSNINNFVFTFLYSNYPYVDSVLKADSIAHALTGSTNSEAYYQMLWNLSGNFTIRLFRNASKFLSSLIYTAWVNAGSPLPIYIAGQENTFPEYFTLYQNYPNPFNPGTMIHYDLKEAGFVELKIFDISGKEVYSLVNNFQKQGEYSYNISAKELHLSSGIYLYRLSTNGFTDTKKMVVTK